MYNGGREAPKQCKMGGDHQKCTMVGGEPPRKYTVPFLEYYFNFARPTQCFRRHPIVTFAASNSDEST